MSSYGFGSKKPPADKPAGAIDLGGLPSSLPPLKREDEARAVAVGETLGFVDRGQGIRRRKPAAMPSETAFATSAATVPLFGFGMRPFGPRRRAYLPSFGM